MIFKLIFEYKSISQIFVWKNFHFTIAYIKNFFHSFLISVSTNRDEISAGVVVTGKGEFSPGLTFYNAIGKEKYTYFFYKQPVYKQLALWKQVAKQLSGLHPLPRSNNKN